MNAADGERKDAVVEDHPYPLAAIRKVFERVMISLRRRERVGSLAAIAPKMVQRGIDVIDAPIILAIDHHHANRHVSKGLPELEGIEHLGTQIGEGALYRRFPFCSSRAWSVERCRPG
ncbi:MAG: hypothetical protein MUF11_05830 [Beijerinckiaceae bacterium]|jgi:hypothetical protein|nr:hypothetical protein [Beijerinckiaceae bacterium]